LRIQSAAKEKGLTLRVKSQTKGGGTGEAFVGTGRRGRVLSRGSLPLVKDVEPKGRAIMLRMPRNAEPCWRSSEGNHTDDITGSDLRESPPRKIGRGGDILTGKKKTSIPASKLQVCENSTFSKIAEGRDSIKEIKMGGPAAKLSNRTGLKT